MTDEIIEIVVEEIISPLRLDSYLGKNDELDITRTKAEKLIAEGLVLVNGQVVSKKYKVKTGDKIKLTISPPPPTEIVGENIPLEIVYEDEHLAVIDKPAGMVTHPAAGNYSGTLVNALIYHFKNLPISNGADRPGIIHRLDKETSGLILIAKDEKSLTSLQQAIQERKIKRTYWAIIFGHIKKTEGEINLPVGRSLKDRKKMTVTDLNSREAITSYKLLKRFRTYDLLEVNLLTGRTHQIRVHFTHLGHPVLGDPDYGGREKWHKGIFAPERPLGKKLLKLINRQALHARYLEFDHPITNKKVTCETDLPEDFKKILELLETEGS